MSSKDEKIIVIGAGIAGLACAARLAAKGNRVSVFEKNSYPGGKIGILQKQGYTFDTGPSVFTQPYMLENLFSDCGKDIKDYLSYESLPVSTHYYYNDGTHIIAYKERSLLKNEIEKALGIRTGNLDNFLLDAARSYDNIGNIFLNERIHQAGTWLSKRILPAFRSLKWAYLFRSMHRHHTKQLQHPKLVQLFDRFATYNGSNPYKAPAMLSMIAHLEMNEGIYYPHGGMVNIANAVYKLCSDLGVQFHFNAAVSSIIIKDKTVKGIISNDKEWLATKVISNSDVYYTYHNLLKDNKRATQLRKQERSSSAVIFYWGMKGIFPGLHLHNIFFAEDYKAEFDTIFNHGDPYYDPTIYINITSKIDKTHAPKGCGNWFVLVNTPATEKNDEQLAANIRAFVIKKLSSALGTDIAALIETETILTPALIAQQTGSYMGALYGTASNNRMAAFMRHSNTSVNYKGLYFVGGTVHPGGGIPLCLRSAAIVADMIA